MKIAIVRGDFLSSWEIPLFVPLLERNEVTMFVGKYPVYDVQLPKGMKKVSLWSPADLNFGKVSRWKMAILNRMFIDAHVLFGLEERLKGFDVAYTAETFYSFTDQCLNAKAKGYVKKVCCHAGENIAFNNEGIWGRRARKQRALREIDKFIAITEAAKDVLLEEGCHPKKIVRAQPGVDLTLFRPLDVFEFRGLSKNKNVKLLFLGRLIEEKGIRNVIRIYRKLHQQYKNTELIVVGTGPLEKELKARHDGKDNVTFLGHIKDYSDVPKVYSLCDLYLHYSKGSKTWVEQYGLTLIEAMACGLPVVGLDRGSVAEVVGVGGKVVNARAYPTVLGKLLAHPKERQTLSVTALAYARKNYDAKKYGQKLEQIFKSA